MSLLMSKILGIKWPIDEVVVQSITIAALVIGVLAFIFRFHHKDASDWVAPHFAARDLAGIKHDMSDMYRDRRIHENISHNLRQLRERTNLAPANPDEAENIVFQIRRTLSSEDWLTRRLAALRKRAKAMRDGHLNRIEELQHLKKRLPPRAKKQLANELKARYNELQFETKLEGLANTLAKNEQRVKALTLAAQRAQDNDDYRKLIDLLKEAGEVQKDNAALFQRIDHMERKLAKAAQAVAKNTSKRNRL